ncbi:MAG: LON peptidase substrate-binding domain-containing protein [Alphaproteobacteria bacterium]|nr:LON peptidase substrate-binding domain-containing protein [Alphaproteobacteria bacterium]
MSGNRPYSRIEDLPSTLAVFPLTGAVLLPRGQLPLNIFEPRYLAMVDAALAGNRLIGMVQPVEHESQTLTPQLCAVGCAGRLTGFRETDDGRYLITLTGICRFHVADEAKVTTPFRQITADYLSFAADLSPPAETGAFPRTRLVSALKTYLAHRDMQADWESMANAPAEALVNALAMLCPFEPAEKQALLEAVDWTERVKTLIALLEMSGRDAPGGATMN